MKIGKKLKQFREKSNFSIRGVANLSGMDFSTIARIESGFIKEPKFCDVVKLCELYGADISELI